jgi:dTDP-4-amino-4,6-dideoxygalactose transaminase
LAAWTEERKRLARRYMEGLRGLPLGLPEIVHDDHVYHLFVVRTSQRDALRKHLEARGIGSGLHYPVPLHRQPCLSHLNLNRASFPVADQFANECLSLPLYVGMNDAQVDAVIGEIRRFLGAN